MEGPPRQTDGRDRRVAAHPGAARPSLQRYTGLGTKIVMSLIGQESPEGALPSLYAAAADVASGEFYGPAHLFHMNGPPVGVRLPKRAADAVTARRLWEASEQLTGVDFELDAPLKRSA